MIHTDRPEEEFDFKVFDRNLIIAFVLTFAGIVGIAVFVVNWCL
jgi:hypothetical protein